MLKGCLTRTSVFPVSEIPSPQLLHSRSAIWLFAFQDWPLEEAPIPCSCCLHKGNSRMEHAVELANGGVGDDDGVVGAVDGGCKNTLAHTKAWRAGSAPVEAGRPDNFWTRTENPPLLKRKNPAWKAGLIDRSRKPTRFSSRALFSSRHKCSRQKECRGRKSSSRGRDCGWRVRPAGRGKRRPTDT